MLPFLWLQTARVANSDEPEDDNQPRRAFEDEKEEEAVRKHIRTIGDGGVSRYRLKSLARVMAMVLTVVHAGYFVFNLSVHFLSLKSYKTILPWFNSGFGFLVVVADSVVLFALSTSSAGIDTSLASLCVFSGLISSGWWLTYYFYRIYSIHCGEDFTEYSCRGTWLDPSEVLFSVCEVFADKAQGIFLSTGNPQPNSEYNCWEKLHDKKIQQSARLCSGDWRNDGSELCDCWRGNGDCNDPVNYFYIYGQIALDTLMGHFFVIVWLISFVLWLFPGNAWKNCVKPVLSQTDILNLILVPFVWELLMIGLFVSLVFVNDYLLDILPLIGLSVMCAVSLMKFIHVVLAFHRFRIRKWNDASELFIDLVKEKYVPYWQSLTALSHVGPCIGLGVWTLLKSDLVQAKKMGFSISILALSGLRIFLLRNDIACLFQGQRLRSGKIERNGKDKRKVHDFVTEIEKIKEQQIEAFGGGINVFDGVRAVTPSLLINQNARRPT